MSIKEIIPHINNKRYQIADLEEKARRLNYKNQIVIHNTQKRMLDSVITLLKAVSELEQL